MRTQKQNKSQDNPGEEPAKKYALILKAGPWKKLFTHERYCLLLAGSLNTCVCQKSEKFRIHITGYLIMGRQLFLVAKIKEEQPDQMLEFFYRTLRHEIKKAINARHEDLRDHLNEHESHSALFRKYPLLNNRLVMLLTGNKISLPYYDPDLNRMERYLHHENFCSVQDYLGAKGPVIVETGGGDRIKKIP